MKTQGAKPVKARNHVVYYKIPRIFNREFILLVASSAIQYKAICTKVKRPKLEKIYAIEKLTSFSK